MADVKWIKINTDIFDDEKFKLIDSMPEADAIELIWFKLLVFAGRSNNNGIFFFNDRIAYTDEMLASVFNRPLALVRLALNTFMSLEMVSEIDGVYTITNWDKHQSISDAYENKKQRDREYSQKYRERQKLLIAENKEKNVKSKKSSDESSDEGRFCSYSISYSKSNSNSNNYLSILPNYMYREYIEKREELNRCIKEWFEYKDNKKPKSSNHYDSELGMTKLLNQFVKNSEKYGTDKVIEIVDFSMSNNYQGIFWEKLENNKPVNSKGSDYMNAIKNRIDIVDEWIGGTNDTTGVW